MPPQWEDAMLRVCNAIGDIDSATAPHFIADLRRVIDNSDEAFVSVDCSDVTFMDSAGYHALVNATRYAARRGHTLMIRNLSAACARLVEICDWEGELRVDPHPAYEGGRVSGSSVRACR
jgi:anti-anti-sigma factor